MSAQIKEEERNLSLTQLSKLTKISSKAIKHYCEEFSDLIPYQQKSNRKKFDSLSLQLLLVANQVSQKGLGKNEVRAVLKDVAFRARNLNHTKSFHELPKARQRELIEEYIRGL